MNSETSTTPPLIPAQSLPENERTSPRSTGAARGTMTELLLLADGRVLAHTLTPEMAAVLAGLNPTDAGMRRRAAPRRGRTTVVRSRTPRTAANGSLPGDPSFRKSS